MAAVVKVLPFSLIEASPKVVEHIETAAKPATAAPVTSPSSPVDVAAHGAATAIQTRMTAMSTELAPKGPALRGQAAGASASLEAQDAANAARMPSIPSPPSPPSPSIPKISARDTTWKWEPPPPPPKPRPGLPQPPGGWSNDPILEDAQRIAYGHAWNKHQSEFPGMTLDQLAELIRGMLTGDPRTDPDLHVGQTPTGTTAIYKDGVLVLYDPANTGDMGTVFKPDKGYEDFLRIIAGGSPIISAPPNLPNIFDHPPVSPLPPTVFDHPSTTALPPRVLDHHHCRPGWPTLPRQAFRSRRRRVRRSSAGTSPLPPRRWASAAAQEADRRAAGRRSATSDMPSRRPGNGPWARWWWSVASWASWPAVAALFRQRQRHDRARARSGSDRRY